jgi:2-polyprenyl-3-methyl-5-hydroxy-6-metoxy-1,4-benzoquinol methylase
VINEVPEEASILDVGCVNHSLDDDDKNWLHGQLQEISDDVTGIDILDDKVEEMQDMGYDARPKDAENFSFNRKFDVIVAGELIEHLSNPGKFLNSAYKHLNDDGLLVLTTPNPWYIFHVLAVYTGIAEWNEEHTTWYDFIVLDELLTRHGFTIQNFDYVRPSPWKWMFLHKNVERWITYPFWLVGAKRIAGNRQVIIAEKS